MPITKQTVAIIGADEKPGSAIAKSISNGNYRLLLLSRDATEVQPVAEEILQSDSSADVEVMDCRYDACWEADIIVMAVPRSQYQQVCEMIEEVAIQKIVVCMPDLTTEAAESSAVHTGSGAAQELQEQLPHSKIITADFIQPTADDDPRKMRIAGDNKGALVVISELMQTAGFNPVIGGDITESGKLKSFA